MNGGRVAGVEYSQMLLRMIPGLNNVAERFDRMQAAASAYSDAVKRAAAAQEELANAKTPEQRMAAASKLIEAKLDAIAKRHDDLEASGMKGAEGSRRPVMDRNINQFLKELGDARGEFTQAINEAMNVARADAVKAEKELLAAEGTQARMKARAKLIESLKREIELTKEAVATAQQRGVSEAQQTQLKGRVEFLEPLAQQMQKDQSTDRLTAGLAEGGARLVESGRAFVQALADGLKTVREFRREVAMFGATGIAAEELQITQQRDELLNRGRTANVLTPDLEASINESAQRQIIEARTRGERDLQQEISRLTIQATKDGLQERLALIELERKVALEQAQSLGQSIDAVNKKFDLLGQLAHADEGGGLGLSSLVRAGSAESERLQAGAGRRDPMIGLAQQQLQRQRKIEEHAKATANYTKTIQQQLQVADF